MTVTLLYLLYAYVQAIVVQRYGIRDTAAPVLTVALLALFAPLVTFGLVIAVLWATTEALARPAPRRKDPQ